MNPAKQLVLEAGEGRHDAAARAFHEANPEVLDEIVGLARRWRERRPTRIWGIAAAFEVLRWQVAMRTEDTRSDFKLNQNYRAWYAREIMRRHPDLEGVFRTRKQHGGL